jgi:hypothetical protein
MTTKSAPMGWALRASGRLWGDTPSNLSSAQGLPCVPLSTQSLCLINTGLHRLKGFIGGIK